MTTYTKTFNYQKNPTAEIEAREVIVLNEDETDFSGFDTKYLTEEQIALVNEEFKDREITADFSSKKSSSVRRGKKDGSVFSKSSLCMSILVILALSYVW